MSETHFDLTRFEDHDLHTLSDSLRNRLRGVRGNETAENKIVIEIVAVRREIDRRRIAAA